MTAKPIVIVGTGLAGYTLARELRRRNPEIPLHLVTADDGASYSKPMLSNALDKGKTADALAMADAGKMADDLRATIWTETRVNALIPERSTVATDRGELAYDRLVLALGADPIRLPIDGSGAARILSVNDLQDYRAFRNALAGARRVAILGAGLIGCEFANDLRRAGIEVDVIDPAARPLGRLLPAEAAGALQGALKGIGVGWHLETAASQVETVGSGLRLHLSNGRILEADVVLSAVGLRPRTQLAEAAGLRVERGIVVDRQLQSSREGIYALGDCAEVEGLVLPFVMPLMTAARALAPTLLGEPTAVVYPPMPVYLKTPDYPVIVCPPIDTAGEWREEATQGGVRALFYGPGDRLAGFALTGQATAEKNSLVKELANWLG